MQKTFSQKPAEVKRERHQVDAADQILGQVAVKAALFLIGKHKPTFTPHVDGGDFVTVVNVNQVKVTGKKLTDKIYYRHSHQPGGLKQRPLAEMLEKFPEEVIRKAVYNMLPKNKLRAGRMRRLKVYTGAAE